jgi:protein TonB
VALAVLALHLVLGAALLHATIVQRDRPVELPVTVRLLQAVPALPKPSPPPALPVPPQPSSPRQPALPVPEVQTAAPPAPAISVQALPAAAAAPAPVAAVAAVPPAPPSASPPAPPSAALPAPREVPSSAIAYRVAPPVAVPLASRRLRESGVVWLRVLVDRQGLPQRVSLHRSSGYARLDEQALAAMQHARFVPQTENGEAIEWMVIAPIAYEVD